MRLVNKYNQLELNFTIQFVKENKHLLHKLKIFHTFFVGTDRDTSVLKKYTPRRCQFAIWTNYLIISYYN